MLLQSLASCSKGFIQQTPGLMMLTIKLVKVKYHNFGNFYFNITMTNF